MSAVCSIAHRLLADRALVVQVMGGLLAVIFRHRLQLEQQQLKQAAEAPQ
eukprot:CAMPEP_0198543242 /NCGR_PEP_ID=MMETSP1462-20131121/59565_1 /TAXON_ID=1333877 /ORGANISM="Brandtodinium nutriculum, Strain RCC3387" /LENGTH=49 /DNA_ID=CAMNT_0044273517 /DNA_START=48 /DNA_END=197 /DNA_ORIENTATION=+